MNTVYILVTIITSPVLHCHFPENYVDGESFLSLTEQDIKDMIPPIGIVKKILKLQHVSYYMHNCFLMNKFPGPFYLLPFQCHGIYL